MTGIVKVQFTINKHGVLLASQLIQSSGHGILDETALNMLKKASPYPSIPEEMGLNQLTISLPVEFTLKR